MTSLLCKLLFASCASVLHFQANALQVLLKLFKVIEFLVEAALEHASKTLQASFSMFFCFIVALYFLTLLTSEVLLS